ncbi:HNH endonuclease [Microtetraspora malaysiensis]|uniref:HNH endonuclease n=1 Tax=Microtetraspora malaysiensis TaxID=161358 RepID=A0ABW6T0L7_9ACTN
MCGRSGTPDNPSTAGHIIPRSKGGTNDPATYRPECRRCNSAKGARWRGGGVKILRIFQEQRARGNRFHRRNRKAGGSATSARSGTFGVTVSPAAGRSRTRI